MDNDRHMHPENAQEKAAQHELQERNGALPTVAAIVVTTVVVLLIAMLVWDFGKRPSTQVGQNVEKSTTPTTPARPKTPQ